jgi:hypothetical protein
MLTYHGRLERWIIDLPLSPLVDYLRDTKAPRLLIVVHIVLRVGDHSLALDPRNRRASQHATQVRIFAGQVLEIAPSCREARHAEARPELHVRAQPVELRAHGFPPGRGDAGVKTRGDGDGSRPGGRVQVRHAKTATTHAKALRPIVLADGGDAQPGGATDVPCVAVVRALAERAVATLSRLAQPAPVHQGHLLADGHRGDK